jgi:hypothetical protein
MSMSPFVRFGALAVLAGLCVPASALAAALPVKGVVYEEVVNVEPLPNGDVRLTGEGAGTATLLGRFSRTETAIVHPNGTLDGTLVFTTINGNELRADFAGAFTSQTTATGTYTFTGGTGRFTGASGTAGFSAVTSDGVHFTITFAGSIGE